jgi:streptogramin lyase
VLVAALAVGAVLWLGEDGAEPGTAALTIDVPRDPVGIAAGAEYVWVASGSAGRVTAFRGSDGEAAGIGYPVEQPRAAELGPGYLWVVTAEQLLRFPTEGGREEAADITFEDAVDVAVTPDGIWVLDRGAQRAVRIDEESLEETGDAIVGTEPQAISFGARSVWVANAGEGTLSRINAESAETVGNPIEVGGRPEDISASGGTVWVVDNFGGRLVPVDPRAAVPEAGEAVETLPRPRSVAVGFDSVWVASGEAGVVQRFSGDGELESETPVGEDPAAVTVGNDRVWVANSASDSVSGIDP